ncbi:hypothetical protein AN640_03690 [Candidatus Epulonipiscium fishelsonii]|uniref:Uncharacterized protein n=1 Tax=Candidatus Epulonipiscium fishelsonii TaxID=77094 RepID=A0ACC8XIU2_9FIRM|nr:hypothetical protein AN640_03690 [Epulopiscium sp. SCG-D08WGA-EpuloA1]OON96100.1 MAG: hypothetical protein ATN32_00955 [Epulopiscium sp. AS2M-Bin002]
MTNQNVKERKRWAFPHTAIIFTILIFIACLLTYILPAGKYEFLEGTKTIDPNSFHFIENTPVNPLTAFLGLQSNIAAGGLVISLLLILGAATEVLIYSEAINSLVYTGIKKFQSQSIQIVVPMIYLLMSILGALCGNDSMMAYVAIGAIICRVLKMDKACAVAMFYLPYITAQAAGPTTSMVLFMQEMLGVPPMSNAGIRMFLLFIFYLWGAFYVTRYALKVNKDPNKSVLGVLDGFYTEEGKNPMDEPDFGKFELKALLSLLSVIICYLVYAYGASEYGWSWNYLTFLILLSSVLIGVWYKMNPNEFVQVLLKGAGKMGGICFLVGFARTITVVLTAGNILHTIAYSVVTVIADLGGGFVAIGMFLFNLVFNIIMPSGITQAALILPITTPIGDVMELSRNIMSFSIQLGDGLTNCITPLSMPLMGSLALAGISYPQWLKFIWKFVAVNIIIACVAIFLMQMMGI